MRYENTWYINKMAEALGCFGMEWYVFSKSLFLCVSGVLPCAAAVVRSVQPASVGRQGAVWDEEGRSSAQCYNLWIL